MKIAVTPYFIYPLRKGTTPVTNTSVNPARSLGPAIFVGGELLGQVWLFWVAPILGAVIAGFVYNALFGESDVSEIERMRETV